MSRIAFRGRRPALAVLGVLLLAGAAGSQVPPNPKINPQPNPKVNPQPQPQPPAGKIKPSLKPIAETRLVMEGLANANFRGLEKLLKAEPAAVDSWTFIRGQALLIAETGNLLMIRPPKGQAQDLWFERATSLRETATQLAASAAGKDYAKSKNLFLNLAKNCNACHQSFSVPVQITPFAAEPGAGKDTQLQSEAR